MEASESTSNLAEGKAEKTSESSDPRKNFNYPLVKVGFKHFFFSFENIIILNLEIKSLYMTSLKSDFKIFLFTVFFFSYYFYCIVLRYVGRNEIGSCRSCSNCPRKTSRKL